MSDVTQRLSDGVVVQGPQTTARQIWDLEEQIAELSRQVAEAVERERLHTLESLALKRDLEVKSAYNLMLERSAVDRQQHIEWLQSSLDSERAARTEALSRAEEAQLRARRAEEELSAERSRASFILTQRMIAWLTRRRLLFRVAQRAAHRHIEAGLPPA